LEVEQVLLSFISLVESSSVRPSEAPGPVAMRRLRSAGAVGQEHVHRLCASRVSL